MKRGMMLWSPFAELERIRKEFDRLLEEFLPARAEEVEVRFMPAVEVYETDGELVVKAEVPGVKKEDIEVVVKDNTLYIRGEKKEEKEEKTQTVHRIERVYGKFERAIPLPTEVNLEGVKAEYKDGVIEIRFPKAQSAKETKIELK
ncbi:Hsp20/alpha crystallin family protein [Thermocrinis minervae]|uniref:HSP20 family protein n=1 Tax=Thermocrinis minervae TaxID=381751 RepID=A0A1M6QXS6_9AQUI|nr:Hsp20/alpha crystallin family protein [Thermocrinis minervae]SHK25082.1 HSP20 family protein [Thermocrinis minervae]